MTTLFFVVASPIVCNDIPLPWTCAYHLRDFTKDDLHACLANKWVHFVGDSTTQMLATKFAKTAKIYLHPCTNATNCLGYWKATPHFLSISYRCKLSRQALPLVRDSK